MPANKPLKTSDARMRLPQSKMSRQQVIASVGPGETSKCLVSLFHHPQATRASSTRHSVTSAAMQVLGLTSKAGYLPVPPTTRMVVFAASGASNSPTSLTSREYSRSRLTVEVTGELMLVNCLQTSLSNCLQLLAGLSEQRIVMQD